VADPTEGCISVCPQLEGKHCWILTPAVDAPWFLPHGGRGGGGQQIYDIPADLLGILCPSVPLDDGSVSSDVGRQAIYTACQLPISLFRNLHADLASRNTGDQSPLATPGGFLPFA
jgi:hypothetical protein